ncbi:MAG: 50S ribosomal protein L11 methyltransferase [Acidimicrobiia bacterium]
MKLTVSDQTFVPSTVSVLMAEALEVKEGDTVIDAGCGSGILSIIAAKLGAHRVIGVDTAPDVVEVASANAERHGVSEVTTFLHGDLFGPVEEDVRADVIIGDVSGIPDELAAVTGWFPGGVGGGPHGSELPIRMLEAAKRLLAPGGKLFLPTGSLQDEGSILSIAKDLYGKMTKIVEKNIPFPSQLAEAPEVLRLIRDKVISLTPRGSRYVWTARVWEAAGS